MNNEVIIAVIGVFLGELYGNFIGGGSLVTQIILQNVLDFNIKESFALDNTAVIGSNIGLLISLWRIHKIEPWFYIFIIFQVLGAFLGSYTLIIINEQLLHIIFLISVIALVIYNFSTQNEVCKEEIFSLNKKNIIAFCLFALFIGAYNAAFVIGDWIIGLLILTGIFHMQYQRSVFLLSFSMLFSQTFAAYYYFSHGILNFTFLIPMIIATIIGGLICGKLMKVIHSRFLTTILRYVSVILVIYLIVTMMYKLFLLYI